MRQITLSMAVRLSGCKLPELIFRMAVTCPSADTATNRLAELHDSSSKVGSITKWFPIYEYTQRLFINTEEIL